MNLKRQWSPSKEQDKKWKKIYFENKNLPLHLITTTQARNLSTESERMIFVDRESEKQKLKKIFQTIAQTNQTLAIRISGAGGVGKTHLIRYIQALVKTKTVKRDLDLNIEEITLFDCCIMDAPEYIDFFNFFNIYTQIWEGFGREDFFEEFSTLLLIKLLKIFNDSCTVQVDEKLQIILGKDWRFWKDFNYQEVRNRLEGLSLEKFFELRKNFEHNYQLIINSIKNNFKTYNYRKMFFNILSIIDILTPEFLKSEQFIENWQLTNMDENWNKFQKDDFTLKKLGELLEIYSWLYPKYVWILALDDLDHLENPKIQQKLFDLLKFLRNKTKNICIILTATIDQWNYFDDSIRGTDKQKQLNGIFTLNECYFDLDYLPDQEMLNWLGRVIQKWWEKFNIILPPDAQWYPFSRTAIEFIINYDSNDKTPRSVGNRLNDLWNRLKNRFLISGKLFIESEFDAWKLMSQVDYTKLNPFTQKLLLSYRVKEKYGSFSGSIEKGLKEMFHILRRSQEFRLIEIVEVKRNKEFTDEHFKSKSKKRKADIYIELQEPGCVDISRIEIQVKAGDPKREITKDELISSFELLKYNYINFLVILSFSELDSNVKNSLEKYKGRYNITATGLSPEQRAFCVLVAYFKNITGRELTSIEAANIFERIFGISPHLFLRSWLRMKKELDEKLSIFESPQIIPKKSEILASPQSEKSIESFITSKEFTSTESNKEDEKILSPIKWILKKGMERKKQWKNRITKTWLLKHNDCPKKEILDNAWKKLIKSQKYGKLEKTTFYIDVESTNSLFN